MPTYEYVCAKCDHSFEKVQSIKENALTTCPKENCPRKPWGKGKIKRVPSGGSGLIFKGAGFYQTDYRSESYKAAAKKEAGGGSSTESKSTSTDSKPAAASTPAPAAPPSSTPKKD